VIEAFLSLFCILFSTIRHRAWYS